MTELINWDMYKEHILDLYKNPLNYGGLSRPTHEKRGFNPLCGDDIKIFLEVEKGVINDASFTGKGCAISVAAASMVSDKIIGMKVKEVKEMGKEDVVKLMEIPVSSGRIKCATLFLKSVQEVL